MSREVFPFESARGFSLTILICLQTDFFMSSDQKNRLFSPLFLLWYLGLGDPSMEKNSEMDFFLSVHSVYFVKQLHDVLRFL